MRLILTSSEPTGPKRAKQIAAATVNKQRRQAGETKGRRKGSSAGSRKRSSSGAKKR